MLHLHPPVLFFNTESGGLINVLFIRLNRGLFSCFDIHLGQLFGRRQAKPDINYLWISENSSARVSGRVSKMHLTADVTV